MGRGHFGKIQELDQRIKHPTAPRDPKVSYQCPNAVEKGREGEGGGQRVTEATSWDFFPTIRGLHFFCRPQEGEL